MQNTPRGPSAPADESALRSVHTSNLPAIFEQLQISLAVSTYQAGKLILVRNDGGVLNTHFRPFAKPMGIAADHARLSVGGANTVWHYRNVPAVGPKLEPAGKHDAAFLPRRIHVTGDIDIHEMSWDKDGELWAVNTRFGCLCTFDADHSFTPRWQPSFLSALAPEDRCHLNGLGMVDGCAKYVTALGETDTAGGWRSNKARGGILVDVESGQVLLRGLSMPHSPRWYQNKLWVLESGEGALSVVDLKAGTWKTVAQMPGFTRGIDFYGPLAFIGLSQVRESAVFSGIPLVQRVRERTCGVWVVHIETGETLGFIRFETGVQEIFAVSVLAGIRYPDVLEFDDPRLSHSYVLPDEALARVHLPSEEQLRATPAYHAEQGTKLYRENKLDGAIAEFREALRIDPKFPSASYNLGVCLGDADQYDEAIRQLKLAAEAEPERAEIYNSLGYVYARSARAQDAVRWYERAVQEQPDYAQAHFNLGMMQLLLGDYARGWPEYAWRWKTGQFTPFQCPQPRWDGGAIPEQTLLLHTEQGAGDAIQFARYVPLAAKLAKRVILVCPDHLTQLFTALEGVAELRPPGQIQIKEFDTWLPLMDLPQVFATTLDNIPAQMPYFDLELLRRRRAVPLPANGNRRVGIVWAGSPTHANDRRRSCALSDLLPLLKAPGVDFYSLQVGDRAKDLPALPADVQVHDLSPQLKDYADTAVALGNLDLVIGVDTSVVHLAGALNVPVWVLLAQVPDWRWGVESALTPWYPSMRLFRQREAGNWAQLVSEARAALGDP
ncbi:MAG: TIGR03032 family protein [Panacagrimonas sp.]